MALNLTICNFIYFYRHVKLTDAEVIGITHHPFSNIIAVYTDNGQILLWKA